MKYIDIYNSVANPLDEDSVLDILAYAYSQRHSGILGFYSQLVKTTEKEYTEKYNPDEYDKFYATAFNKWKKGIVSLTKEEFEKLKERKIYDDRLIKLRNYLKTVPDVTTAEEARKIMNQDFNDDALNSAMKDYCWDSMGRNTDWEYVVSSFLNGNRINEFLVTHRLYLNVEPIDIHTVLNELIQKCDEHGIPYYFKIDKSRERDDNLVVYSDTEKLPFYIKMLQEIAKKHPEVKARSKTPPVLTGKIDGWIGYGSEPEVKNGKRSSFNLVRSKCIEQAFTDEFEKWFSLNKNITVNYQGQNITLMEYIAVLSTEQEIEKKKRMIQSKPEDKTQEEYEKSLGYNYDDLKNPELIKKIYSRIKKSIQDNWNNPNQKREIMTIKSGTRTIRIYGSRVSQLKDLIVPYVMKHDPSFRNRVKNRIKALSSAEGIDAEKYCFDIFAKERLLNQDQNNEQMTKFYQSLQKRAKDYGKSQPRAKGLYESNRDYLNYLLQYAKDNNIKVKKVSKKESTYSGGMTEKEIRQSQIKLGFIKPDIEDKPYKVEREPQPYSLTRNQIIQDLPIDSQEESTYSGGMTDEEIRQSQIKLGFIKPDIEDKPYKVEREPQPYSLTRDQIIQDLPINSQKETTFTGGMTDEEIKAAQKKIGTYQQKRR